MTIKQKLCLLTYLGYYVDDIKDKWTKSAEIATEAFQEDYGGLKVDGICGAKTEKALTHAVAYGMPVKEKSEDFWDDIKYFRKSEFKCKCGKCGGFPVEPEEKLVRAGDKVRGHFNKTMVVTSGVRCATHNKNVGGVTNSRHLKGKAMDFAVSGLSAELVLPYVKSLPEIRYAYAIDSTHIHMDID